MGTPDDPNGFAARTNGGERELTADDTEIADATLDVRGFTHESERCENICRVLIEKA